MMKFWCFISMVLSAAVGVAAIETRLAFVAGAIFGGAALLYFLD